MDRPPASVCSEVEFVSDYPLDVWFNLIEKANVVGFDWETTGLSVYDGTDHGIGFSVSVAIENDPDRILSEYFPVNHSPSPERNLPRQVVDYLLWLVSERIAVVHNALFDMAVTRQFGVELTKIVCTMKYDHLINENYNQYSLEEVSKRWMGHSAKNKSPLFELALLGYGWDMPVDIMRDYALSDAGGTLKTFLLQNRHVQKKEPKINKYWTDIEAPVHQVLSHMRKWGVEVDVDLCRRKEQQGLEEKSRITEFFGFNPGSPLGLSKLLFEELGLECLARTSSGKPQFDKKAMERYETILSQSGRENNDVVRELLTYRGWTKAVSAYYKPYQRLLSPDGRLRPEYRTAGPVTGRWSCADPNLQQIPKETDKVWNGSIKDCLVSAPGYTGWEVDYSQLEFRLTASATRSKNLLEIFEDPTRDIFNEMALALGWERQPVKVLSYLTIYGGGKGKLAETFGVSVDEAAGMLEHFYAEYPNLRIVAKRLELEASRQGWIEIWSGRRRHFRNDNEAYKAFNSFIQGGAADLVKGVMVTLFKELINDECRLLLQVHDSLWFEIKQGKEEYYLPQIKEIMTRCSKIFNVNLTVDAHPWSHREAAKYAESRGISA
jgi:DNA polymerase-1